MDLGSFCCSKDLATLIVMGQWSRATLELRDGGALSDRREKKRNFYNIHIKGGGGIKKKSKRKKKFFFECQRC